ncbi:hypothetical protein [Streptococcus ruminicola]|nr:hypothetical protein [Streptococcus ruminicola]
MNDDVLPALLEEVQDNFGQEFGKSEVVVKTLKTLEAKKATYANANDFAIEVGEILSKALTTSVTADKLPDGKMYYNIAKRLLEPVLQQNHELVADYSSKVQTVLNESAKISLVAQPVELNQDRIDGFIERFSREDKFDDVKWLLGDPIVNFTQSIVDDSIKKNAEFHAKAGLQPKIVRKTAGRCCKWCQSLAGSYNYPDVPKDVYRRHQNCRCTVDYKPGDGKKKNIWSKKVTADSKNKREQRRQMNIDIRDNNRKSDRIEYLEFAKKLDSKFVPVSLAKFQELKYNDVERYKELKDRVVWSEAKFPSEKSFNGHFKSHGDEFTNISKGQYQKAAASLLAEPVSEDILGYDTESRRVRYDRENNIIAIGKIGKNKNVKITTMFRPDEKEEYYYDDYEREHNHD